MRELLARHLLAKQRQGTLGTYLGLRRVAHEQGSRCCWTRPALRVFRQRVDQEARQFVQRQLPHLYAAGTRTTAKALGVTFTRTTCHRDAFQPLTADSCDSLPHRAQEAEPMASQPYRQCARPPAATFHSSQQAA